MARLLKFDKEYIYELFEGNNPGEFEVNFPQLSVTLNLSTEEKCFYKRQVENSVVKKLALEFKYRFEWDDEKAKEYLKSAEWQKEWKELLQKNWYKLYYTVLVWWKDIYNEMLSEAEKYNIKEETKIESMNIEIVE